MVVGRWRGGQGRRRRRKKKKEKEKIDAWMYNTADQIGGEVEGGRKKRGYTVSVPVDQDHVCCEKEREGKSM
jgi:hypothetical protein